MKPKRTDLSFTASAEGYRIFYKGRMLGGASIRGKYQGRNRVAQVNDYRTIALREIAALVQGHGQERFRLAIQKIEDLSYVAR